jgi:SPP1 gp7 family putative phage head morphogenesis protein
MYGKRFTEMKEQCAKQLLNVNQTALAYVNGELPEVYALNYNALAGSVDGVGGYSFTLVDADTVRNLAVTDKSLLPYKELDPAKDIPWNMKKINAETLQGILQGESMDKIAKRLRNVQEMNKTQAIRSARTIVTGAENKGRQDSYARAEADGIILQKEWLATNDGRTRHSHAVLDGAIVDQDKKFDNGLMYPGDPSGRPEEVYNCRCTLVAKVNGFKKVQVQKAMAEKQQTGIETAKTNADIVDQMNKNGWFSPKSKYPASLDGADFESAMSVYRGYEKFYDRYPQMKGKFLPVVCEDLSRKQAYAQASTFGGGVSVNRSRYSRVKQLAEDYAKDVRLGFHTKGTDYQSLVTHECGHGLDGYLTSVLGKKKSFSMDMRKSVLKATGSTLADVGDGVSIYATKDNYEFFAECLAEGLWSENPRPIAREFMKQLDEVMKGVK